MINITTGLVKQILHKKFNTTHLLVEVNDIDFTAICFDSIVGIPKEGDIVVLNTTAEDLQLGSGGYHFVLGILFNQKKSKREDGHILKMRYTPFQFPTLCVEDENSPYHDKIKNFKSLDSKPVIVGGLLSQVGVASCVLKKMLDNVKITYIMDDSSSLPLQVSNLIFELKEKKIIDHTITCGQAFGGDYEAINIYSALSFAREVLNPDVIIMSQGVGNVGTGTKYGFSAITQGEMINAVNVLNGVPVAIPRISFADRRERHYGISHHSITVLSEIAILPAIVCIPEMAPSKLDIIISQIKKAGIDKKHIIRKVNADITPSAISSYGMDIKTMGRGYDEDSEFFLAAGACAIVAIEMIKEGKKVETKKY